MTTAHETSDAFSDETLREQKVFQHAKESEMKEMLGNLADGQIEFYKAVSYSRRMLPEAISNIIYRPWKSGSESFPSSNAYAWTSKNKTQAIIPVQIASGQHLFMDALLFTAHVP